MSKWEPKSTELLDSPQPHQVESDLAVESMLKMRNIKVMGDKGIVEYD
jgi:hypothetical protein